MKGMRFAEAFVQLMRATDPEKWSRYCQIAAEISGANPASAESAGRNLIMRRLELKDDTFDEALRADPGYLRIFFETLALEMTFTDLFLEAMRSNKVSVIAFDPDDVTHPIKITPEMMDVTMDDGRTARVKWDTSKIKFGKRRWFGVRVTLKGALGTPRGGRPTAADWDAVQELLRREIKGRGWPNPDNERGWRTKEDVSRWVAEVLQDRKESAAESTIRSHVNLMLKHLRDQISSNPPPARRRGKQRK